MKISREQLEERANEEVCECFKGTLLSELSDAELKEIINDAYFIHEQDGETWEDCPQWAQERAEYLADEQTDIMRGK